MAPGAATALDPVALRARFPVLQQRIHDRPLAYLDYAATAPMPEPVLEAWLTHERTARANVHRGLYELARRATEAYDEARRTVAAFLGVDDPAELIFTRGTTEAINLVAATWATQALGPGDEILLTRLEHHANLVPWQWVARRTGARLRFLDLDAEGRPALDQLDAHLSPRTKLVAVAHVSNALGTVVPVAEIAARAHAVGARVLVDGAQSVGHLPLRLPALGCDFFAFSGHKLGGPMGIGGLWARRELLEAMPPYQGGGDMIERVDWETSTYAPPPRKFEAGTPNVAGAVALAAACRFLDEVGREAIHAHEAALTAYALERLAEVPDLVLYGPRRPEERAGILTFTLGDVHAHDLATILDAEGIAIRASHHCTQPLHRLLGVPATARASLWCTTTSEEIDRLVAALHTARRLFRL